MYLVGHKHKLVIVALELNTRIGIPNSMLFTLNSWDGTVIRYVNTYTRYILIVTSRAFWRCLIRTCNVLFPKFAVWEAALYLNYKGPAAALGLP